ncbi:MULTISPECIES: hypothetical protein [unclassified Sphingobacterium]|nr:MULTISPECIES: hypothetical protein [unclassified Sphingobacterium]
MKKENKSLGICRNLNPDENLPLETITTILNAALNLYRDGKISC